MEKEELKLIFPEERYLDQIWAYRQAMLDAGSTLDGTGALKSAASAEAWLESKRQPCPAGKVPSDQFLAIRTRDDRLVGMIDFRHSLDHPVLALWGGHIGYSVHPAERRKGYATEMLRQVLEKCRAFGLDRVMVTCHEGNIGSEKTIRACGGEYEKTVDTDSGRIKRFWIALN